MRRVAQLPDAPAESVALHHCPVCGSGGITGKSDGTTTCSFCGLTFQVYLRSNFPAMPRTLDGEPFVPDGSPEGVNEPIMADDIDTEAEGIEGFRVDSPIDTTAALVDRTYTLGGRTMGYHEYLNRLAAHV